MIRLERRVVDLLSSPQSAEWGHSMAGPDIFHLLILLYVFYSAIFFVDTKKKKSSSASGVSRLIDNRPLGSSHNSQTFMDSSVPLANIK